MARSRNTHRWIGGRAFAKRRAGALLVLAGALFALGSGAIAQPEDRFVAIKAGKIITVSGEEIEGGTLVLRNGKVDAVGKKVETPRGATILDASDQVVMPGLVNPRSRYGLRRYTRTGVKAHLSVKDELNHEEGDLERLLAHGFTTLGLIPAGRGFPGQAVAVRTSPAGKDGVVREEGGYLRVTFTRPQTEKQAFLTAFKTARAEIEKVEKARKAWEEKKKKEEEEARKKAEAEKKKEGEKEKEGDKPAPKPDTPKPKKGFEEPKPKDPPKDDKKDEKKDDVFKPPPMKPAYVPLVEIIQKKPGARMLLEIDNAGDAVHVFDARDRAELELSPFLFVNNQPRSRSFYSSGLDLGLAVEQLGKEKATVVLYPRLNRHLMTALRMNLAQDLARAGCQVAFVPFSDGEDGHETLLSDLVPLIRSGLSRENALRAVTLNAAAVLGLDGEIGSLEPGKAGDLLFLSHDPFDPRARVMRVMVDGKTVAGEGLAGLD